MGKETKIALIRHGLIENPNKIVPSSEFGLSEEGKRQVLELCSLLKAEGFKPLKIYTSPFARTQETAHIIALNLNVDNIEIIDELRDTDPRNLQGKPLSIVEDAGFDYKKLIEAGFNIEPVSNIYKRVSQVLEMIINNHQGENIAIVSHGDCTRLMIWFARQEGQDIPLNLRDQSYLQTAEAAILIFGPHKLEEIKFIRRNFKI